MFTSILKTASVRRVAIVGVLVVASALTLGAGSAPAHAQYYSSQYSNPYYSAYPYNNGYPAHYNWWRWHQYWRWYHQNYSNYR
jgi:hypothetical protein